MARLRRIRRGNRGILGLALLLAGCGGGSADPRPEAGPDRGAETGVDAGSADGKSPGCNGAALLCGRRYHQVAYPCTHNAMSSAEENWIGPNQTHAVPRQLRDGVRALMLDLHLDGGQPYLCHTNCAWGKKRLKDGLSEIRTFMEESPREVVTLILESYVSAAAVKGAMEQSGLLALAHAQPPGKAWPTLGAMVQSGKRLVVFTDRDGGAYPWYHAVWDHAWETHWSAKTPADLSCARNRGKAESPLFILNHFLTDPVAMPLLAEKVNKNPFFIQRAKTCQQQSGRLPNFVTVDFYEIGDLLKVVATLNGLTPNQASPTTP